MGLLLGIILLAMPVWAGQVLNDALVQRPFSHHIWHEVLQQYLTQDGRVDFVRLRAHPKRLNQYLKQLATVSPDSHPQHFNGHHDRVAYWINAHNALALRQLLDLYPVTTIPDVQAFLTQARYHLGGQLMSLGALESRLIAVQNPSDTVMALSLVTVDTPPLLAEAYRGDSLTGQLARQRRYVATDPLLMEYLPGDCAGLRFSVFFHRMGPPQRSVTAIDEETLLEEPLVDDVSDAWVRWALPGAPPEVRPTLAKDCPHRIEFTPQDPQIRQAL